MSTAEALLRAGIEAVQAGRDGDAEKHFVEAAAVAAPGSLLEGRAVGNLANLYANVRKDPVLALQFNARARDVFAGIPGERDRLAMVFFNSATTAAAAAAVAGASGAPDAEAQRASYLERAQHYMGAALRLSKDNPARLADARKWLSGQGIVSIDTWLDGVPLQPEEIKAHAVAVGGAEALAAVENESSGGAVPPPQAVSVLTPVAALDETVRLGAYAGPAPPARAPSAHASPLPHLGGGGLDGVLFEFGYENLWFTDVLSRHEAGMGAVDATLEVVKARAAAEEAYAKAVSESVGGWTPLVACTGLGVGPAAFGSKANPAPLPSGAGAGGGGGMPASSLASAQALFNSPILAVQLSPSAAAAAAAASVSTASGSASAAGSVHGGGRPASGSTVGEAPPLSPQAPYGAVPFAFPLPSPAPLTSLAGLGSSVSAGLSLFRAAAASAVEAGVSAGVSALSQAAPSVATSAGGALSAMKSALSSIVGGAASCPVAPGAFTVGDPFSTSPLGPSLGAGEDGVGLGGGEEGGASRGSRRRLRTSSAAGATLTSSPAALDASVSTGGFDSLRNALAQTRKSFLQESVAHFRHGLLLRDLYTQLSAYRASLQARGGRLTSKAQDVLKITQTALSWLRKAKAALERARKEADETGERYMSAKAAGVHVVPEAEIAKRHKKYNEALAAAAAAEDAVCEAGEAVVSARKRRNEELTGIARQLQKLDEERQGVLARCLQALHRGTEEMLASALEGVTLAAAAGAAVDVALDTRMFIHQRRVAIMLQEIRDRWEAARSSSSGGGGGEGGGSGSAGSSSGSSLPPLHSGSSASPPPPASSPSASASSDPDTSGHIIPYPLYLGSVVRHGREYIAAEAELAPQMYRWVVALLKGEGHETLGGEPVTPLVQGSSSDAGPAFEIKLLLEPAARSAFLRALSARRSLRQNLLPVFERLVRIFWWILDVALAQDDTRSAQTVLILGETFYRPKPGVAASADVAVSDREYVQERLRGHPIWTAAYWHEALYRAVRDELNKIIDPSAASNSRLTSIFSKADAELSAEEEAAAAAAAAAGGGEGGAGGESPASDKSDATSESEGEGEDGGSSGGGAEAAAAASSSQAESGGASSRSRPSRRGGSGAGSSSSLAPGLPADGDVAYAYSQILFGQLMALAINMKSFGVDASHVRQILLQLAVGNGLPRDMVRTLLMTIE